MLDAVAEDIDSAALVDFALKPGKDLAAGRAVLVQTKGCSGVGLSGVKESLELDEVDAALAIVVVVVAGGPANGTVGCGWFAHGPVRGGIARIAGQSLADEAFEAAFGEVGGHLNK